MKECRRKEGGTGREGKRKREREMKAERNE